LSQITFIESAGPQRWIAFQFFSCVGRLDAAGGSFMKRLACGRIAALAAAAAMTAPHNVRAADFGLPTAALEAPAMRVADVALGADGSLNGQVMTLQGQPLANQPVVITSTRQQAATTTDAKGQFRFAGLRGGAYAVHIGQQTHMCRAWKAGTAPPSATRGLMVVQGHETALGQFCGTPVECGTPVTGGVFAGAREALRNPLVIGGIVAAAIAIPVAVNNSDDDDTAS
jgi:hypothetical protein